MPPAARLHHSVLLSKGGHHPVEVVLLDPHRLGELGDGDPGAGAGVVSTPERARSAASRRWNSSTSGRSSLSRAWISLRFSSRKSGIRVLLVKSHSHTRM